jgi:hypothetical protein
MAAYSTPPQSFFTVYQVFSILIPNPWIDNTRKFLHEKRQFQHTGLYVRMDESMNGKDRTGPSPRLFLSSGRDYLADYRALAIRRANVPDIP